MGENKRTTGAAYEKLAAKYLVEKGYKILTVNYYTRFGEIDIVARDGMTIVFVEVKYRKSARYGHPYEAVNKEKRRRIMLSALAYGKKHHILGQGMRFDIIDILKGEITHYKHAFELDRRLANF